MMFDRYQAAVVQFLEAHQTELVALMLQSYAETAGHYAAIPAEARARQAANDVREFSQALSSRAVDFDAIGRAMGTVADQSRLADVAFMITVNLRLFAEFVVASLPEQPDLARELVQRAHHVGTRLRLALTQGMERTGLPAIPHSAASTQRGLRASAYESWRWEAVATLGVTAGGAAWIVRRALARQPDGWYVRVTCGPQAHPDPDEAALAGPYATATLAEVGAIDLIQNTIDAIEHDAYRTGTTLSALRNSW
jgi:hypothetical protein